MANLSLFEENRVFSANEMRRMDDVRFALTIVITTMSTYFNRDEALEKFLANYNDSFPERSKLAVKLQEVLRFFDECQFESKSRVWKRANLFTMIIELHKALIKEELTLDPQVVRARVDKFFEDVERLGSTEDTDTSSSILRDYYKAALQATNDRSSRILRGMILGRVIRGDSLFGDEPTQSQLHSN